MHAPHLLRYEVANALTRLITANAFPQEGLTDAWRSASGIPIMLHPLNIHGPEVVAMALRLGRRNAYDAAYLALADQLGADLWTFDGPLARNATSLGFRVHLIERTTPTDG